MKSASDRGSSRRTASEGGRAGGQPREAESDSSGTTFLPDRWGAPGTFVRGHIEHVNH